MKASAVLFAAEGDQYLGTPYSEMDCQAFVETMLRGVGINRNLRGSNAWFREMDWTGTPEECKRVFGCIPLGAMLYIWQPDGAPSRYKDDKGNATHIGVYIGRMDGAIHSSQSRGKVCYSKFAGKTIRGGWNRVGLWHALDYGQKINGILNHNNPQAKEEQPMQTMQINCPAGETVRLRAKPSTNDAIIAKVPSGTIVQGADYDLEWSRVDYNGQTGYMMNKYLAPILTQTVTTPTDLTPVTLPTTGDTITLTLPRNAAEWLRDALVSALGVG